MLLRIYGRLATVTAQQARTNKDVAKARLMKITGFIYSSKGHLHRAYFIR
jgi:hypothetical protein